ncbi:type III pantothenate kinase [Lutibacter sp.]|uniref:type III pantothenate kinase n=1 Tax=Lutibacter sp. TaxID=1925666 RepID=UPI003565D647
MNLVIDVGNTKIKLAVFNNSKLIHNESITIENFMTIAMELIKKYECTNAIISSVASVKKSQINKLRTQINLIELSFFTKVPFKNEYSTPKTLGVDRIALVSSAILKFPNKNVLIIDAGTCITYDFVDLKGSYFGGAISPGINMRYKALNAFTNKLPLLEPEYINQLIGDSTEKCIHSGVINGVISEIDSFINQYREKNKDLTVVLTGGDTNFLANRLKNSIFANPFFLLEGLNRILKYNL